MHPPVEEWNELDEPLLKVEAVRHLRLVQRWRGICTEEPEDGRREEPDVRHRHRDLPDGRAEREVEV